MELTNHNVYLYSLLTWLRDEMIGRHQQKANTFLCVTERAQYGAKDKPVWPTKSSWVSGDTFDSTIPTLEQIESPEHI